MKHARRIPLALFVTCLVASTPFSWAAAATESQRKPGRTYPEMIEIIRYLPMAAGMVRMPLPKIFLEDVLPSDVGNAGASSESSSVSSRAKVLRLLAPTDPIETVTNDSGTSSR